MIVGCMAWRSRFGNGKVCCATTVVVGGGVGWGLYNDHWMRRRSGVVVEEKNGN